MKKFLVIDCDNAEKWREYSFADMFADKLKEAGEDWVKLLLDAGENLPNFEENSSELSSYKGIVVTGSRWNCRDGEQIPWFGKLCRLIQVVHDRKEPRLFGGCFGAQIIAHALGGRVDYNPSKQLVMKAEAIRFVDASRHLVGKYLLSSSDDCPEAMSLLEVHGDCVAELPPGSKLLATSSSCENEIYLVGSTNGGEPEEFNVLAVQSHPEFDLDFAICRRIWESEKEFVGNKEEQEASWASFESYSRDQGADKLMLWIKHFLVG